MITSQYYGSITEANEYFQCRLHTDAWDCASPDERLKALKVSTRAIDRLNFKGCKASLYALKLDNSPCCPTLNTYDVDRLLKADKAAIDAAHAAQPLMFPRNADTEVPEAIRVATYENAYSLLDGVDPDMEMESLAITQQQFDTVRTSYNRDQTPLSHFANGIASPIAWRHLLPYLRDRDNFRLVRVN